jgi:hypothetical protein
MKIFLLLSVAASICLAAFSNHNAAATSANQAANVCAANPAPATPDLTQVDTPSAGDTVTSPVTVRGRINAFEATFRITIFDATGNTIADVTAMSSEGQVLAPFQAQVPFSVTRETAACLWVYEISGRGDIAGVVQVPLILRSTAGGLPQTGDGSQSNSASWPAAVSLAGLLLAVSGATIAIAAARRPLG